MRNTLITCLTGLLLAGMFPASVHAASAVGTPKTSQHATFKPQDFERLAVIVKPIDRTSYGFGRRSEQSQLERMVEQSFLRVLLGSGFTMVSRADLDAAIKEKGLDAAGLTDEKLGQEAGKILHVSAIMVVSVENFKTSSAQSSSGGQSVSGQRMAIRPPPLSGRATAAPAASSGPTVTQYFEVTASVSARLVKVDDNMVLWTGDLTTSRAIANKDQDGQILSAVAEAIASAFPPFAAKEK